MQLSEQTRMWIERDVLQKKFGVPKTFVAITGKNHCGKSLVARTLAADFGFEIMSLASVAKERYAYWKGIPVSYFYDPIKKEQFRPDLIRWCDEQRAKDIDVFVKEFVSQMYMKEKVVCDDLRLLNEFEAFQLLGAKFVRVQAVIPIRMMLGYIPNEEVDKHPTECDLDHVPHQFFEDSGGGVLTNLGLEYYNEFINSILDLGNRISSN